MVGLISLSEISVLGIFINNLGWIYVGLEILLLRLGDLEDVNF